MFSHNHHRLYPASATTTDSIGPQLLWPASQLLNVLIWIQVAEKCTKFSESSTFSCVLYITVKPSQMQLRFCIEGSIIQRFSSPTVRLNTSLVLTLTHGPSDYWAATATTIYYRQQDYQSHNEHCQSLLWWKTELSSKTLPSHPQLNTPVVYQAPHYVIHTWNSESEIPFCVAISVPSSTSPSVVANHLVCDSQHWSIGPRHTTRTSTYHLIPVNGRCRVALCRASYLVIHTVNAKVWWKLHVVCCGWLYTYIHY